MNNETTHTPAQTSTTPNPIAVLRAIAEGAPNASTLAQECLARLGMVTGEVECRMSRTSVLAVMGSVNGRVVTHASKVSKPDELTTLRDCLRVAEPFASLDCASVTHETFLIVTATTTREIYK